MRVFTFRFSPLLSLALLLTLFIPRGVQAAPGLEFDRVEDTTLYFKGTDGSAALRPRKTDVQDLKYLGVLRSSPDDHGAESYFLFTGRPCKGCLQDAGIYAIHPTRGRPIAYVHPGKIFDHKSRALILESRAFFGRCLSGKKGMAYVVFQKERVDKKKKPEASVLVAEPGIDHLQEHLIERNLPRIQATLALVKAKACFEINGRNRVMPARPLGINTRRDTEESEDQDQEEKKDTESPDSDT